MDGPLLFKPCLTAPVSVAVWLIACRLHEACTDPISEDRVDYITQSAKVPASVAVWLIACRVPEESTDLIPPRRDDYINYANRERRYALWWAQPTLRFLGKAQDRQSIARFRQGAPDNW